MSIILGVVKSLHIYPIKGMKGIDLNSSKAMERGLENDRRWMLVDKNGNFITQRTNSNLALFRCELGSLLKVFYGSDSIEIDLEQYSSLKIETTVWDTKVMAYEVSDVISDWFAKKLGVKCHLVKMVNEFDRYKKLIKGPEQTKVSFADGYPYLIVGTASLNKVSQEVGSEIPADRFRANIVVETQIPHEEDTWNHIRIGSSLLQVIKPCARCTVVNIDQATGIKDNQPLKTLSLYRKYGNKVNFGANVICLEEGNIKIGDTLEIDML